MHRCLYHHLLFWILVLVVMQWGLCKEECIKTAIKSCSDCIQSGRFCAWCKQLNYTKQGDVDSVRCDTRTELEKKGCEETNIIYPKSTAHNTKNRPLSIESGSEKFQIQPQGVKLILRPGMPHTFSVKFKRAEDYPVDLYYLMDLSYSMNDDLQNVKKLGKSLLEVLQQTTTKARIGFGSFIDKTVLPFTNTHPEKLQKPCPDEEKNCRPAFGYQHVLSLTDNVDTFTETVSIQNISGNLDRPEGSLDAIMQVAVCGDKIGWGNSTRLLVVATDDGFHMAGDGKLGSIFEPNDGQCHLDEDLLNSKNNEMDYPSVGQVATKLADNNIQTIFAVTERVEYVYKALTELIPKSEVGALSNDSSNIVTLIKEAYEKLSSNVILSHEELPDGVTVTYSSHCKGGDITGTTGRCNNVKHGEEVIFNVTVTATRCMEEQMFRIRALGFIDTVTANVLTRCECDCDDSAHHSNHSHCNNRGKVVCGTCSCQEGFAGQTCQCELKESSLERQNEACRLNNGTECSGQGECVCGLCECHASKEGIQFYGTYCQCSNTSCESHGNKICAGNGKCDCGKCICNAGYGGSACQCKMSLEECMTNKSTEVMCSKRGECECGVCRCKEGYELPYCEECTACSSPCSKYASCIECKGFEAGPLQKNCNGVCTHLNNVMMVDSLRSKKPCREKDSQNCWMTYVMKEMDGFDRYEVQILKQRECPPPPNIGAIIGGAFTGVALIGLFILLVVKAVIWYQDLVEYKKHEEERLKAKWSTQENVLFKAATSTVQNPFYTGD
nr:integrin beta-2-like [Paramormyrops kingsleyae]XP_023670612.1 integrin beta-2-like [Paramormyrops kingsleyae]